MKRKIKYIVIGVIVVVVVFVYAHVDKPNYIYDSHTRRLFLKTEKQLDRVFAVQTIKLMELVSKLL